MTYLASGGKIGDTIRAEVTCDKCVPSPLPDTPSLSLSPPLLHLPFPSRSSRSLPR